MLRGEPMVSEEIRSDVTPVRRGSPLPWLLLAVTVCVAAGIFAMARSREFGSFAIPKRLAPPLLCRCEFPPEWRVILVGDRDARGLSGGKPPHSMPQPGLL